MRSDDLRRRIFEAVSLNLAHEAIWYTKTATKNDALSAHSHRLAEFDAASRQEQSEQFVLITSQLRQKAAKAANLLVRLGETKETTLSDTVVKAVAQSAGLNPRYELEGLLTALQRKRLIDRSENEAAVLGVLW